MFLSSIQEVLKALGRAVKRKRAILDHGIIEEIASGIRRWSYHLSAKQHIYTLQPSIKR